MTEILIILYLLGRTYWGWRIEFMERLIERLWQSWAVRQAVKVTATIELIFMLLGEHPRKEAA
jgi:hypothetical protein